MGATTIAAVGLTTTSVAIAMAIGLATYAVIGFALKALLVKALKLAGGNEFLETLIKIAYVVINVVYFGGKELWSKALTIGNAYLDTLKADIQLATLELEELFNETKELKNTYTAMLSEQLSRDTNKWLSTFYSIGGVEYELSPLNQANLFLPVDKQISDLALLNAEAQMPFYEVFGFYDKRKALPTIPETMLNAVV
jgi:hypothetical protein